MAKFLLPTTKKKNKIINIRIAFNWHGSCESDSLFFLQFILASGYYTSLTLLNSTYIHIHTH